jgi:hypothetical protein
MRRVKSFELLNHSISVEYIPDVFYKGKKVFGTCDPLRCKILVATHSPHDGSPLAEDMIQHNFGHEAAHYKMYFVDDVFYHDEDKIDLLGAISAQYEKTKVYEELP